MASPPSHHSADPEKREKHSLSDQSLDGLAEAPLVDDALEKRVWRKLDLFVLPVVSMFYLLSFIVSRPTQRRTHAELLPP
jgi:hypothetical protein